MYGFRNCSSPYVINSNLYIRILVTVRCFHSCRHIPQLFYLQPHPARSKHMCRWYQKFVHNILTLLLDPQALCPPLPFLPQFVLFINTKKSRQFVGCFLFMSTHSISLLPLLHFLSMFSWGFFSKYWILDIILAV